MAEIIKVTLDIAGMFFRQPDVEVPRTASVKDVMDAVVAATANGSTAGTPTFSYTSEPYLSAPPGRTVNTITVVHRNNSAKSRQNGGGTGRIYRDGIYSFSDDSVFIQETPTKPQRLSPADPNKTFVLAWQYYVYDKHGVDQARKPNALARSIVPFDKQPDATTGYQLSDGDLIVWRLVAIFLRPTHDSAYELPDSTGTV